MAIYHGVGVNFGISSSLAAVTGAFQTRDHNYESGAEIIANGSGDTVEKTWYDVRQTATFEYVSTGAGPGGSVAVTMPTIGSILVVSDTGYTQIANSYWLVDKVSTKGSNTSAVRVTVNLTYYPLITS
jgi:hypothetical protein